MFHLRPDQPQGAFNTCLKEEIFPFLWKVASLALNKGNGGPELTRLRKCWKSSSVVDSMKRFVLQGTYLQSSSVLEQEAPRWMLLFKSWMRFIKQRYTALHLDGWCSALMLQVRSAFNFVRWKDMLGVLNIRFHLVYL